MSDSPDFLDRLLARFFADLRVQQTDNYDHARFSYDGVDRSECYDSLFITTMKEIFAHAQEFSKTEALFANEASRDLYFDLLRYRLSGHKHVRLFTNTPDYISRFSKLPPHTRKPSEIEIKPILGNALEHYEFDFEGASLKVDTLGIRWPFVYRQYFYEQDGVRIRVERGDHVIDAGACWGDSALAFGAAAGKEGFVYLFEPIDAHLELAKFNLAQNEGLSSFKVFASGLSDTVFCPEKKAGPGVLDPGFSIKDAQNTLPTTTLDHLLETGQLPCVDFIKMDIEGSELQAIQGAKEVLMRFKPKLAISLYHTPQDFYAIPLFLDGLGLGYRFYLGHYTIHAGETVLYANVP